MTTIRGGLELEVPSLVDALYTAVRSRILTGVLAAGCPLTEMDLATQYSVARPTAKAALVRLVFEGLLRRSSNKTARVPVMTSEDIRDLYRTRLYLEREVMKELAGARIVPAEATKSLDALRAVIADPDHTVTEVVGLDIEFHLALVSAVDSPRLNRLYRSLIGEVHLCMAQVQANRLAAPGRIVTGHAAILKAIASGEPARAAEAVTSHLDGACKRLAGYAERSGEAAS